MTTSERMLGVLLSVLLVFYLHNYSKIRMAGHDVPKYDTIHSYSALPLTFSGLLSEQKKERGESNDRKA